MASIAVASESRIPVELDREFPMLIGGEWLAAQSGATFHCTDPYSGRSWGEVPHGAIADVDLAVAAARRAFDAGPWPRMAPAERARILRRIAELIRAHADELVLVQVLENGKLASEMKGGMHWLAELCDYAAGLGENIRGETMDVGVPNMFTYTLREPIGVVAAITPWNSPLGLLGFKLFPALAAGCTVVMKPSEFTPISTIRLAELCVEAGLPPGVINVVTGYGDVGRALVEDPRVDKIMFTGSTPTGRAIAKAAGERLTRVSLELGGKSPNIVFANSDLDQAIHGIMGGIYAANGQTCVAGSRVLIQRSVYDDVLAGVAERTARLRMGDPLDLDTQIGPMANAPQLDKVLEYIEIGRSEGARVAVGGHRVLDRSDLKNGLFVAPTVLADVDNASRVAQEEIFGPVASAIVFDTEEDALRIANDTQFGLAAAVWTQDMGLAQRMVRGLRSGTVWINTYRIGHHYMPFGGVKQSGLGRELGRNAVEEFTEVKSVWLDYGNPQNFGR